LGITIVLITHEMQVIREICDQVVVIDAVKLWNQAKFGRCFLNPNKALPKNY
jgi:D-methionine transport system ATP-binding protein